MILDLWYTTKLVRLRKNQADFLEKRGEKNYNVRYVSGFDLEGFSLRIAGVDDAGRGPVIGPLTIAGVLINEEDVPKLVQIGVKDSKLLSPRQRNALVAQVKNLVTQYDVVKLWPYEIDRTVENAGRLRKLNRLEALAMARVINALKPEVAYVDASDVSEDRFKEYIVEHLTEKVKIVSKHKADRDFPIVGAASIIAKVERDGEIERLRETYGDFGSGYPTDPKTIKFLEECIEKSGEYPDFVRRSWKPAKKVKERRSPFQTKLEIG
jgi:ribonuclease HII